MTENDVQTRVNGGNFKIELATNRRTLTKLPEWEWNSISLKVSAVLGYKEGEKIPV